MPKLHPPATPHPGGVLAEMEPRLARVRARFDAELLSDLDCVNRLVDRVRRFRGKMLRPVLVLLAHDALLGGEATPGQAEAAEALAAVMEMVHMATLVHDDVLDDADARRGGATVNQLAGNEAAVMLGDVLISHSYHLCCGLGNPALARGVAAATNAVCEGELLQLSLRGDFRLGERTYLEVIARKTAALTEACCRLPARLLGVDEADPRVVALSGYGRKLGMAFQVVDDLLDLEGDPALVGKTLGLDLARGKLTLPVIRWLEGLPPDRREAAIGRLGDAGDAGVGRGGREAERLRREVLVSEGPALARERAAAMADTAADELRRALPAGEARDRLLDLASALLARRR
ncbi:polyprenyl synthetase family protein [Phycisphaera mikurensis]|uniref:Putative polyprenyl diphosphate synthase n=1 Tax=Phycisphaera mikurensis (strain NBRC 102666 / KCTC 22515 / FYK2301M01) TaxID=1142394 RepID=I0IGH2_PHYMF|nr:polyprenyl synthetase family protein [Phycisphaera mikurensis]MBB6442958.1 octaprenyl-diphosphate synthase [Phycisphaera mikurensis]BAM04360.1 putative polyprenyl diphosphate synthase [Phycisphaera mikurensis NBRC 102666]